MIIQLEGRPRSLEEMDFVASMRACEACGDHRALEWKNRDLTGGTWMTTARCPKCGEDREYFFVTDEDLIEVCPPPLELGDGISTVITPAELARELERLGPDPGGVNDLWERMLTALNELAKFIPAGAAAVPGHERYTHAWLDEERARLNAMVRDESSHIASPPPAPSTVFQHVGPSMSFDEALARTEPRVGAWDYRSDAVRTLRVYSVGLSGASLLAVHQAATTDEREDLNDRLREHGMRIGGTHGDQEYVWAFDHDSAAIWSGTRLVAKGTSTELSIGNTPIARAQIAAVVTWFDTQDLGRRGVRCVRRDASAVVVVEETSDDLANDTDGLERDLEWAYFLGQDLSLWLDVPHRDQLSGKVTNDWMRTVAFACRKLARRVDGTDDLGAFEPIRISLGAFGRAADLSLELTALAGGARSLELLTTSKTGRTAGRRVKQGTNAQIAVFLRQLRTPGTLLTTMSELLL